MPEVVLLDFINNELKIFFKNQEPPSPHIYTPEWPHGDNCLKVCKGSPITVSGTSIWALPK